MIENSSARNIPPRGVLSVDELSFAVQRTGRFVELVGKANKERASGPYDNAIIIVQDLAHTLGFTDPGTNIPKECPKRSELRGVALGAIPMILNSERASTAQRVDLVSRYPDFLVRAGFALFRYSGETQVRDYLQWNYVDETELLLPKRKRSPEALLYGEIVARWRRERLERWRKLGRRSVGRDDFTG